ncbi:hypothetical protein JVU11DRAFT_6899 [Chiua virens]|nr:hypothetical protein JVU11DRAFT_6899 [Chiua virens]
MRSLDRTSHSSLSLDDMIDGEDAFREGLRQLPQHLVRQFYIAKLASRDCILARIASNLGEIDALEKTRTVLLEVKKHDQAMLATTDQELTALKEVAETQCSDIKQDIAFRHAVYADELVALTVLNTQLSHMLNLSDLGSSSQSEQTSGRQVSGAQEHDGSHDLDQEVSKFLSSGRTVTRDVQTTYQSASEGSGVPAMLWSEVRYPPQDEVQDSGILPPFPQSLHDRGWNTLNLAIQIILSCLIKDQWPCLDDCNHSASVDPTPFYYGSASPFGAAATFSDTFNSVMINPATRPDVPNPYNFGNLPDIYHTGNMPPGHWQANPYIDAEIPIPSFDLGWPSYHATLHSLGSRNITSASLSVHTLPVYHYEDSQPDLGPSKGLSYQATSCPLGGGDIASGSLYTFPIHHYDGSRSDQGPSAPSYQAVLCPLGGGEIPMHHDSDPDLGSSKPSYRGAPHPLSGEDIASAKVHAHGDFGADPDPNLSKGFSSQVALRPLGGSIESRHRVTGTASVMTRPSKKDKNNEPVLTSAQKRQKKKLWDILKRKLVEYTLSQEAMVVDVTPRDELIDNKLREVCIAEYNSFVLPEDAPFDFHSPSVDFLWKTRDYFHKFADDHVEQFFGLKLSVDHSIEEGILHRREAVQAILSDHEYSHFHSNNPISICEY